MKISVIIPTVRKEKMLDFQLPNYAKQTFPKSDFEIIIIDDCPIDRKDSILDFGKKNGLNIKWMRSKKPYYRSQAQIGNARNTGLIHAQGELIVFNDDFSGARNNYLENVWNVYKQNPGFSHIGPVIPVEYGDSPYQDNINDLKVLNNDDRLISIPAHLRYGMKENSYKTLYKEHRFKSIPCSSGWFYTSNASASLDNIIKVNGFWEMADLTREEDILMGLALERVRWKFCFIDDPGISIYHMVHHDPSPHKKYVYVTYESIGWPIAKIDGRIVEGGGEGGRCGLDTNSDNVQLITKDVFGTKYPGAWALSEHFRKNPNLIFNQEIGFNLANERKKIGL